MILKSFAYKKRRVTSYIYLLRKRNFSIISQHLSFFQFQIFFHFLRYSRMERTDETRRRDLVSRGWSDERRRQFGGRDGIDARLNRARSPIPGWSRENLFGKRYRCEQSSAVEKRCESRHKFYPVDSRRKRNKKTIFFFKGWISLFFKQIYIPRKDRNCMRILCIKKKSYKAELCIINMKNIRNECLNVQRPLKWIRYEFGEWDHLGC